MGATSEGSISNLPALSIPGDPPAAMMKMIDLPPGLEKPLATAVVAAFGIYLLLIRYYRFKRCIRIQSAFKLTGRPLSSMTVKEAHAIVRELRELEFPYTLHTAMKLSLLKTAAIPTMSKLFVATGQLNERNVSKRAIDTEVILNEVHDREPGSENHLLGIARMNYLHARYRKAGKILDEDMLHTLGSAVVDILRSVDRYEWRKLTDVEKCAVGVFHRALGDAMEIPFTALPSSKSDWRDGAHFAQELFDWTLEYERKVAKPTEATQTIGRRLVGLASFNLPAVFKPLVEGMICTKLDDHIQESMGLNKPGPLITSLAATISTVRKYVVRYLHMPRPDSKAVRVLRDSPEPASGLYTTRLWIAHPWYIRPTFKNRWGLRALFTRLFGSGVVPVHNGPYRDSGYDLRTIGPAAQENKGKEEMEAIFSGLKEMNFASGCPFHT